MEPQRRARIMIVMPWTLLAQALAFAAVAALLSVRALHRLRRADAPLDRGRSAVVYTTIAAGLTGPAVVGLVAGPSFDGIVSSLVLPAIGGCLGYAVAEKRSYSRIDAWRVIAKGVVIASVVAILVMLAIFALLAYAFAHSNWQF